MVVVLQLAFHRPTEMKTAADLETLRPVMRPARVYFSITMCYEYRKKGIILLL